MLLLSITMLSTLVVLIKGLFFAINAMSRGTCNLVRIAWLAMTTGAFGVLVSPLYGHWHSPTVWEALLVAGIALYGVFDRRQPARFRGLP